MAVPDAEITDKIKQFLKWQPRGMTISDLSSKLKMSRNLVAKYLDLLLVSGGVEMQNIGAAKVFFLSNRIPISGLLEFSSDLVIVLDHDNTIRRANERALFILGLKKEDIVGKKINETGNPFIDNLQSLQPLMENQDIKDRSCELAQQVNGEIRSFRIKTIPTAFEDGTHGTTLVIEDTTHQRRYQDMLEKREAQYRGIVEDQTDFITRFLPDGTIVFSNHAYARYLRKSPDEVAGQKFLSGIHDDDLKSIRESLGFVTHQQPVTTLKYRILHESGGTRWNQWTVRGLFDDAGSLVEYQAVGQDVTDNKATAEKIKSYLAGMEFLSHSATAFIDMGEDEDIHRFIAEQLYSLVPDSMISINSFDPKTRTMMLQAVKGSEEDIARLYHELGDYGRRLVELMLPIDINPDAIASFKKHSLEDCPPLYDMFFHQIPEEICTHIEERIPLGRGYTMGFVCRGGIFGSVIIKMKKGCELKNRDIVEAFISQAAVALLRRYARKDLLESQEKNVKNMEFLSRTAMAFVEMDEEEDIYRFIAEQIQSLIPGSLVGVNAFDPVKQTFTLRSETGDPDDIRAFNEGLGRSMIGAVFPMKIQPQAASSISMRTLTEGPSLYDFLFRIIPEERCVAVENSMGRGSNYTMGLCCRGGIFGTVGINIKKGTELTDRETIEAFIHQASVALLRRHARKELRASEETRLKNMEFLSRTSMAFVDMEDDEDIYRFITDQIHGFCPDLVVGANSFDMARGTATLRSISGLNYGTMEKFSEWRINPLGMAFPLKNDMTAEEIVSRKCLTPGPERLHDLFFQMVPEQVCAGIEELINWGGCYAMGCVCRGEIFGSIVLIVQQGKALENKETIEAFISQAGFALHHRRTRELALAGSRGIPQAK